MDADYIIYFFDEYWRKVKHVARRVFWKYICIMAIRITMAAFVSSVIGFLIHPLAGIGMGFIAGMTTIYLALRPSVRITAVCVCDLTDRIGRTYAMALYRRCNRPLTEAELTSAMYQPWRLQREELLAGWE